MKPAITFPLLLLAVIVIFSQFILDMAYGACSTDRDFFCSGPVCPGPNCCIGPGLDPDCCDAAHPCPTGLYCDVPAKTCISMSGQACLSQTDCSGLGLGDSYCSPDAGLCVSNHFVFIKPLALRAAIGTKPMLTLTVFDPANRTGTYTANVVGTGAYFARFFGTSNTVSFFMGPNEVKTIPVYFSAGAIGNYQLRIQVVDSKYGSTALSGGYPKGIVGWSETANVEVVTETRVPTFVSASGPPAKILLPVLGTLAFILLLL